MSITSTPKAGSQYLVKNGDRLDNIEKSAYGYVTGLIEAANPKLSTRGISLENRPIIYAGDVLNIPILPERRTLKTEQLKSRLTNKDKNTMTIIIGNREMIYTSARLIRTMDTAADCCTLEIPWTPKKDTELDEILLSILLGSFPDSQVFIGNELLLSGAAYGLSPDFSNSGNTIDLEIWSYTADVIDSTMPEPFEANNITLQDRANQLIKNIGIKAIFEFDPGGPFDRVTADINDTIFSHLSDLATQRGLLISSTPEGNLLFTKAKTGAPVGTIESGQQGAFSFAMNFDGRQLFNTYTAFGESPGNPTKSAQSVDENVPRSRFMSFKADNTTSGDIQKCADWQRSKANAKALTMQIPYAGWYAPNDSLWRENTTVTIKAPEIFIPNGFTFLIPQVEYVSESSGSTTTLSILPSSLYTGGKLVLPWEVE